jgi:hypothetical protein
MAKLLRPIGALAIALCVLFASASGHAQDPSIMRAASLVDQIAAELKSFHIANQSVPREDPQAPAVAERQGRHVVFAAWGLLRQIQAFRRFNGMPPVALPPVPGGTPDLATAIPFLESALGQLREMRAVFGEAAPPPKTDAPVGSDADKTATDIYGAIIQIWLSIAGFDQPPIDLNESAALITVLLGQLDRMRQALGYTEKLPEQNVEAKRIGDVYTQTFMLLRDIRTVVGSEGARVSLPKPYVMPNRRIAGLQWASVYELVLTVLADVAAMKAGLNINEPMPPPEPTTGNPPSTVFESLLMAKAGVLSLK